jgi:hypothetical protein
VSRSHVPTAPQPALSLAQGTHRQNGDFFDSIGQTLHFCDVRVVSAFHPIATKSRASRHFGFGPTATSAPFYSITLSARSRKDSGRLKPSADKSAPTVASSSIDETPRRPRSTSRTRRCSSAAAASRAPRRGGSRDFGETKADFRCVPLGHEKSHVLPPGTRPRRRWIRFMRLCFHSARGSTVEARGCVIASGSRGWRVGRLKIPQR